MLKFVSSINLITVDNIAAECSTHGDRYTMCVHNLCIRRRCIYFFSLRISHMSLQVLRPGDICLLSTLTSFGILITLQCSIGDPSITNPMRVNYLVLLDEHHIHAILKKAGVLVFNPPEADFKAKIYERN